MPVNEARLDRALKLIEKAIAQGIFPGAVLSIGNRSGVYRTAFYGNRCLYPERLPVLNDTLFDMASLTKIMATTMLFMVYLEKGMISLYDKAGEYLERFRDESKGDITLLNLLTHTSGLPAYKPLYKLCGGYEDAIRYICETELEYSTGSRVIYSDLGFIILGYILEMVGEDKLDALCRRLVFEPLDMVNTSFNPGGRNIAATEADDRGIPLVGTCHDENARFFGGVSGHAGLFSNNDDFTKFTHMLINLGKTGGSSFLSHPSLHAMIRNYTPGLEECRGIGWCIKGDKLSSGGDIISPAAFGHTGFTGTSIWVDMDNDIYINLLTNRVHPSRENTGIIRFRRLFHNAVMSSIEQDCIIRHLD